MNNYDEGNCEFCGAPLKRIMVTECEEDRYGIPTGRKRQVCDHIECINCGKIIIVDDDYCASEWK